MTSFFVNLPLGFLFNNPEYKNLFLKNDICPELGIDAGSMDLTDSSWHLQISEAFRSRNIGVSMHMPFNDLNPGSLDGYIRKASMRRLVEAAMLSRYYQPKHVIIHSGYRPEIYDNNYSEWLKKTVLTWRKVLEKMPDVQVYLENVYEQDPLQIRELLTELEGRAGFCFDLGHWFSAGRGSQNKDLHRWLNILAPFLKHLHLHDNNGIKDEHLAMGAGKVPFASLFAELELLDISPTFTLEPHSLDDFVQNLVFILEHENWFSLLGAKNGDLDHLKRIVSTIQV